MIKYGINEEGWSQVITPDTAKAFHSLVISSERDIGSRHTIEFKVFNNY
jgi:hypothetical protein